MVPPPEPEMGNVWLGLKLMTPLDAIERPVAAGPVPEPKRSASLAVGDAVSLPDTSVCQAYVCATALADPLLYALAPSSSSGEFCAAEDVATLAGVAVMAPLDWKPSTALERPVTAELCAVNPAVRLKPPLMDWLPVNELAFESCA